MNQVIIIAEAGVNHNGNIENAKKLIDVAKESGADYIKFQTFKASAITTKDSKKAQYQIDNTQNDDNQFEMLSKLELQKEEFIALKKYCDERSIGFLSSAFDIDSVDFLNELGMDYWKIPSGEITNLPYLRKIAKLRRPIIVSTGMADFQEIERCLDVFISNGVRKDQIFVLQCTTNYPSQFNELNLNVLDQIHRKFSVKIGFSDHSLGIEASIAAVALGAKVIEKHFTLDKNADGPDHKASLDPNELKSLVDSIRNVEQALGSKEKFPSSIEEENKKIVRKSIVAKTPINRGELFSENNLTTKRPGIGISPMKWDDVIGKKALKDYKEDDPIQV